MSGDYYALQTTYHHWPLWATLFARSVLCLLKSRALEIPVWVSGTAFYKCVSEPCVLPSCLIHVFPDPSGNPGLHLWVCSDWLANSTTCSYIGFKKLEIKVMKTMSHRLSPPTELKLNPRMHTASVHLHKIHMWGPIGYHALWWPQTATHLCSNLHALAVHACIGLSATRASVCTDWLLACRLHLFAREAVTMHTVATWKSNWTLALACDQEVQPDTALTGLFCTSAESNTLILTRGSVSILDLKGYDLILPGRSILRMISPLCGPS